MQNVVPIDDLPDFIDRAIAKVSEGVALARRRGILAELPNEVQFEVTVVSRWQHPDLVIVDTNTSTGRDNGTNTSVSAQKGGGTRTSTEKSTTESESKDESNAASTNGNYTYTD
jgi:hypothetical protein